MSIRSEEVHKLHRSHSVISLLAKEAFVSPGRNGVLDITISHLKHGMGWESLLIMQDIISLFPQMKERCLSCYSP